MANKYKGEIAFPIAGEAASYLRFDLEDLAEVEALFGRDFFPVVEEAAVMQSPKDLPKLLALGLKARVDGEEIRIWGDIDKVKLLESGFKIGDAGKPILEALVYSWLGKSYEDLILEAEEARKKQMTDAVRQAKEAAEAAGAPFDETASLNALLKLLTEQASQSARSGA